MEDKTLTAQVSELREKLRTWKKIKIEKSKKKSEEEEMAKLSIWNEYTDEDKAALEKLAAGYIDFISRCKTERESVVEAVKLAEAAGYQNLDEVIKKKITLKAGDKVYSVFMKKAIALFQIGNKPIEQGLNILGAHIDTCRLDLKQNPLYEESGLAYMDTHYYGGIKKYQWVTLPLAMHGVVVKRNGRVIDVVIGEEEGDPVFCVTDLLIHLWIFSSEIIRSKRATKSLSKKLSSISLKKNMTLAKKIFSRQKLRLCRRARLANSASTGA